MGLALLCACLDPRAAGQLRRPPLLARCLAELRTDPVKAYSDAWLRKRYITIFVILLKSMSTCWLLMLILGGLSARFLSWEICSDRWPGTPNVILL